MTVVMQLFFERSLAVPDWPDFEHNTYFCEMPLWRPNGHPVYVWAVDYAVCTDTRWVVVGPFDGSMQAVRTWQRVFSSKTQGCIGFNVFNEHCFSGREHYIYTDG